MQYILSKQLYLSFLVRDILRLLAIESVTETEGISICQKEVCKIADELGFHHEYHANNRVIVISPKKLIPNEPIKLGFVVHLDTVPFDKKEWHYNPLGEIANGRIYGRGIIDDKGAIIMCLYALYQQKPNFNWQVIVGSCEEGVWYDMQDYLAENPILPEFMVTVDGDGIQNGCRGYMDIICKFKKNEQSPSCLTSLKAGDANNSVPAYAEACIDGENFTSYGKAAHSSNPANGENALLNLAKVLQDSHSNSLQYPGFLELLNNLHQDGSFSADILPEYPAYKDGQFVGYTTICPTKAELLADSSTLSLWLNVRINPFVTCKDLVGFIKKLEKLYGCETELLEYTAPAFISTEHRYFKAMLEANEEATGQEAHITFAQGVGYNAALPNCAIFGPRFEQDEEDLCHAADESRTVEDIWKCLLMLESFISKI